MRVRPRGKAAAAAPSGGRGRESARGKMMMFAETTLEIRPRRAGGRAGPTGRKHDVYLPLVVLITVQCQAEKKANCFVETWKYCG